MLLDSRRWVQFLLTQKVEEKSLQLDANELVGSMLEEICALREQ